MIVENDDCVSDSINKPMLCLEIRYIDFSGVCLCLGSPLEDGEPRLDRQCTRDLGGFRVLSRVLEESGL